MGAGDAMSDLRSAEREDRNASQPLRPLSVYNERKPPDQRKASSFSSICPRSDYSLSPAVSWVALRPSPIEAAASGQTQSVKAGWS